ncbi:hypothetical protein EC973_002713 [Apophysomyces ossiformis]|uniref:Uncharacterized protein n=1 Tax=Apophysomyces ossiformis TaxID=679940 RepID=A0A8H7BGC7_9FUNG|nr:hypothetical protein EC973_002713 [Apophysomyces ossiformis]
MAFLRFTSCPKKTATGIKKAIISNLRKFTSPLKKVRRFCCVHLDNYDDHSLSVSTNQISTQDQAPLPITTSTSPSNIPSSRIFPGRISTSPPDAFVPARSAASAFTSPSSSSLSSDSDILSPVPSLTSTISSDASSLHPNSIYDQHSVSLSAQQNLNILFAETLRLIEGGRVVAPQLANLDTRLRRRISGEDDERDHASVETTSNVLPASAVDTLALNVLNELRGYSPQTLQLRRTLHHLRRCIRVLQQVQEEDPDAIEGTLADQ